MYMKMHNLNQRTFQSNIILTAISHYNRNYSFPPSQSMSNTQILQLSVAKPRIKQDSYFGDVPHPHEYSRSSTKRIYESVFRIIDFDQKEDVSFEQEDSNSSKLISLISDDTVISHLYQKMRMEGNLDHYPILKVYCQQLTHSQSQSQTVRLNYNCLYQLQYSDLTHIFQRFGDLGKIILSQDMKYAFIFFTTFHSAYIAYKLLNGMDFGQKLAKLHVNWADNNDYEYLMPNLAVYLNSINWQLMYKFCSNQQDENQAQQTANQTKQNKLTCRYDIQIQNERDFQVARRIIGSKGSNMKRIIQQSIELAKQTPFYRNNPKCLENANELLKLRLRGKGSGYKEGPQQQESEESLHLCVSAKDDICYQFACQKVESLLFSVYEQYYEYTLQQFGRGVRLDIMKNSVCPIQESLLSGHCQQPADYSQPRAYYTQQELNCLRITPQKICELLEMRNKARRELNFLQADRIRNFLRNCGVCLIDEKGRRGRAMDVTTWKYVF